MRSRATNSRARSGSSVSAPEPYWVSRSCSGRLHGSRKTSSPSRSADIAFPAHCRSKLSSSGRRVPWVSRTRALSAVQFLMSTAPGSRSGCALGARWIRQYSQHSRADGRSTAKAWNFLRRVFSPSPNFRSLLHRRGIRAWGSISLGSAVTLDVFVLQRAIFGARNDR